MTEISYEYKASFGHALRGALRFRRQQRLALLVIALEVGFGLLLLGVMVLGVVANLPAAAQLFGAILILYIWVLAIGLGISTRKIRRVHGSGSEVVLKLQEEGLEVKEGKRLRVSPWSRVKHASYFRDGIVLVGEKGVVLWLPDEALRAGNSSNARKFIETVVLIVKKFA